MRRKSKDKTQLEANSVGYMPERFIAGYFELVRLGLKIDPSVQIFNNESSAVKKKYYQHDGGLRDEPALRFKAWVDRQLRAIGRDMQAYLNARESDGPSPIGMSHEQRREIAKELERKTELQCKDCGNYISWQWAHCAWCGRKIYASEVQEQGTRGNGQSGGGKGKSKTPADYQPEPSRRTRLHVTRKDGAKAGRDDESEASTDSGPRLKGTGRGGSAGESVLE